MCCIWFISRDLTYLHLSHGDDMLHPSLCVDGNVSDTCTTGIWKDTDHTRLIFCLLHVQDPPAMKAPCLSSCCHPTCGCSLCPTWWCLGWRRPAPTGASCFSFRTRASRHLWVQKKGYSRRNVFSFIVCFPSVIIFFFIGSSYMSALEVGGLLGSLAAGYFSDKAVAKVSLHSFSPQSHSSVWFLFGLCAKVHKLSQGSVCFDRVISVVHISSYNLSENVFPWCSMCSKANHTVLPLPAGNRNGPTKYFLN